MLDFTRGVARERLDPDEFERLLRARTVIVDDRRRRPLYFDGRFLTARDLTREQAYFLSRQADLARAGGAGVVEGLAVERGTAATTITVGTGHGITPSGELVVLADALTVNLADVVQTQRLDTAFGIARIPAEPARNRTGLFIVALRPVEFTANPIASYPTSITGTRSVEDGDIIEAVAVTLIPYPDDAARDEMDQRRARAALDIFVRGSQRGLPAGVLPLAMVALDRAVVQWVDPFLVRREVGAERADTLSVGIGRRALREAQVQQYEQHLRDVLEQRQAGNRGLRFAASEHFSALPPVGRMPSAALDPADFSQLYFPAQADVALSVIPEDEIGVLVEESLLLPPIDLTLSGDELESTAVLVLVPVERGEMRRLQASLTSLTRPLITAVPGLLAKRRPIEALRGLVLPRQAPPVLATQNVVDAAWRQALAGKDLLWYVRRRNLRYKAELAGTATRLVGDEAPSERSLTTALRTVGATTQFGRIKKRATSAADAEMTSLVASPKFAGSRTLLLGSLNELEGQDKLDRAAVLKVAARFSDPTLGEGVARLEAASPELKSNATLVQALAKSGAVPELDRLAAKATPGELATLAADVTTAARTGTAAQAAAQVAVLVKARLAGAPR
jgi:hypothetical protein